MTNITKPDLRPANPNFSSGPCSKRPGWSLNNLENAVLGRSHRAKIGKARLKYAIDKTHALLGLPDDYLVGIMPASDTGAFEAAMWTMLGERGVDVMAWESFGSGWVADIIKQLKLDDVRDFTADYGQLPDLAAIDFDRDVVFTWNGTTSGARVPNGDWISADRTGLTMCDATSAAFAQDIDWPKIDVATFSWQKVMGGEAQHGIIVLSPRAVARLESYTPAWPVPKIFRMSKGGKLIKGIFQGATINTPSMLCVEDYIDGLEWADSIGGAAGMRERADKNTAVIANWVSATDWVDFLADDAAIRSNTSVCLKFSDPEIAALDGDGQAAFAKSIVSLLDAEGVAYDIGSYRDAPAGLRVWAGSTVEASDMQALMPWLDWAFATAKAKLS